MLKRKKLSSKLALVIGGALTIILVILIGITIFLSRRAISSATYEELHAVSKSNALQIQDIFNEAQSVAEDMRHYLEQAHKTAAKNPSWMEIPTDPEARDLCESSIYGTVLTATNYDIETYLRETARNSAGYNDDLAGVGVMFEPYKFQEDMKDYAFYVSEDSAAEEVRPFGSYDTYSQEVYYQMAAEAGVPVVTQPYEFNGITMVSYASPVFYNDELQCVVMGDIKVSNFDKVDTSSDSYPSMYATIYSDTEEIIYDSEDKNDIGSFLAEFTPDESELQEIRDQMALGEEFQLVTTRENGEKVTRFFSPIHAAEQTWWSLTAIRTKDINKAVSSTVFWMILLSVVALVVILTILIAALKKVLGPVQGIVAAAKDIANGKLDVTIEAGGEDEIGDLARTFQGMSENLDVIIVDMKHMLEEMANGNFAVRTKAEDHYVGEFEGLLSSMRKMNRTLSSALGQINDSADQVAAGSDQMSASAQALSQGATEQASSVEEQAATIAEILEHVKETAEHAAEARELSAKAGEDIRTCNGQMHEMIDAMDEIGKKSAEIEKIIKTIEDIAFQTNILALNAAVEAARAGTAGKGFAVVADEVRSLASKSAEASKNTSALIQGTVSAVDKGTRIVNETEETLLKVVEGAQKSSEIVDQIAAAAAEQSESLGEVTLGVDQISNVVHTNSATSEETAATSEQLSSQAQMLKRLVNQFRLGKE